MKIPENIESVRKPFGIHMCEKCIEEIREKKPYIFELESGRVIWLCRRCSGDWVEIISKEFEVWVND